MCEHLHLWWFSGHLDASLQDCDRKLRMWRGAEPEPEVWVGLLHLELLHQLVQPGHPGEREVAVGEEHPVTWRTNNRTNKFYMVSSFPFGYSENDHKKKKMKVFF